jgi:hypothetical protein
MKHNKELIKSGISIFIMLLYILAILSAVEFNLSNLWFLTPGLWQMSGPEFWSAFLKELVLVILRILPLFFLFGMVMVYAIRGFKAQKTGRQNK